MVSTYDAENHLAKSHPTVVTTVTDAITNQVTTTTQDQGTATIGWGPNDHPALVAGNWVLHGNLPAMTLHWDGDMLLFVTDTAGNVVDFKVGLDGDVDPTNTAHPGPNAIERDPAGVAIEYANITDYSGLLATDPSFTIVTATGNVSFPGSVSPYFQYNRSDGLSGIALPVAINGIRAFDSTLGTWTTPDAYQGDVHDPASQQRYMWNRNNPYDYSDPSGYAPSPLQEMFDDVFGDDLRTLADRSASAGARQEAMAKIIFNFVGPGEVKAGTTLSRTTMKVLGQAARDGVSSLLKSARSLQAHIERHLAKIDAAKAAGGFTSSMEREVRDAQNELGNIKKVIEVLEKKMEGSPGGSTAPGAGRGSE